MEQIKKDYKKLNRCRPITVYDRLLFVCQEWQVLEGTILQLVSELFLKLKQQKTDTGTQAACGELFPECFGF